MSSVSTDAEVLETLAEKSPLAIALLNLRKSKKLLSTYVEKMIQHIDVDGRLRTGFSLHTTTSGRLSSSGTLNLQQLPRDNPLIKGCIKPRAGYKIVALDRP
jgi:DNA polymerase I-like protein with 3'-5' exonuclease and polymerase domains